MSLKDDKQQNLQMELDFSSAPTGEAREAGRKETEPSAATIGTENPASTNRMMEAVCGRENLKAALRQVRANKGSPGVDGMTVVGIKDYLKQHWPAIREQLLNGTYEPKPVWRVERRFAPLMDVDFAISCPLVRCWRLISGSCPSTRTFVLRFFQTPPRGD